MTPPKSKKGPPKVPAYHFLKKEQQLVRESMVRYLLTVRPQQIANDFRNEQTLNLLIDGMCKRTQWDLHTKYPKKFSPSELLTTTLDQNARRIIGQIVQDSNACVDLNIPDQHDIAKKISNAYRDYKNLIAPKYTKGKQVVGCASAHGSCTEGREAPGLKILQKSDLQIQTFLGAGVYGKVQTARILNLRGFDSNILYVVKTLHDGQGVSQMATEEITNMPKVHAGIVRAIAFVRDDKNPMLIMDYWNGGVIERWFYLLSRRMSSGSSILSYQSPKIPSWFCDDLEDVPRLARVKKHILSIIVGLVRTMHFVHTEHYLHNDLHARNVVLHFPEDKDEVYVGVIDWGMACRMGANKHYPAQIVRSPEHLEYLKSKYPHVAPECFGRNPPLYNLAQDVFSMCYVIRKLLTSYLKGNKGPLDANENTFVKHLIEICTEALDSANPEGRPLLVHFYRFVSKVLQAQPMAGLRPLTL